MTRPKIVVHLLIKNEERFIWYAINSVLPHVDQIMVWDTGSTDDTLKIVESIKSDKIKLKKLSSVDALSHTATRQKMLDETDKKKFDWLMILDGDEIWPDDTFDQIYLAMENNQTNAIAVHTINFVGDIYHKLPESAGQYNIAGVKGHLNLRFMRLNLPALNVVNPHGGQTYVSRGIALQSQEYPKVVVLSAAYFHATHLIRSRNDRETLKRFFKRKYELGPTIKKSELPQVFFMSHPQSVPSVTAKMSLNIWLLSLVETPFRRLRRLLFPIVSGYIHQK